MIWLNFGRILTAMITPFNEEGQVDYERMTELINHLIENNTDGLVVTGTTGESVVLSEEETEAIYEHVVRIVDKRIPVLAGTGSNDTKKTIALTKKATAYGVDGIMLVSPYYNRPNQAGLYEHFKAVANETELPVMLYNIPGRTGVHIDAETIIRLAEIENIVAVKEASGDLEQVAEIIANTDDNFTVYSGDDSMTLPMMAIGARGVVSVASHIIGNEMKAMIDNFLQGEIDKAAQLHRKLLPIMNGLFMTPSPAPLKAALRLKGLDVGSVRLPLVDLTEEELKTLKQILF